MSDLHALSNLLLYATAFVAALAGLLVALQSIGVRLPQAVAAMLESQKIRIVLPVLIAGALLAAWQIRPAFAEDSPISLNEELTTKAWIAYNEGDLGEAISWAEKCVDEFQGTALRQQRELEEKNVPVPDEGAPESEAGKLAILKRGPLNDVATSFWIAGRSAQQLGESARARRFYQQAAAFPHALTWETKGWFWSPSKNAQDRLNLMKE